MWRRVLTSPWVSTTLLVLLLLVISLYIWGLAPVGPRIDYTRAGNWSELISGLASAIAVIVAVASLAVERRKLADERRAERVAGLTRVYAWLEPRKAEPGGLAWVLRFENQMRMPVYAWRVVLEDPGRTALDGDTLGPIRPGASELLLDLRPAPDESRQPRMSFEFADTDGTRWLRASNGRLVRTAIQTKEHEGS